MVVQYLQKLFVVYNLTMLSRNKIRSFKHCYINRLNSYLFNSVSLVSDCIRILKKVSLIDERFLVFLDFKISLRKKMKS